MASFAISGLLVLNLSGFLIAGAESAAAAVKLESYNVAQNEGIFVSGFSAGGAMAMQLHIAFSQDISGAALLTGLPYACAKAGLASATACMLNPTHINTTVLIQEIYNQAAAGNIDPVRSLSGDKAWIFHGNRDITVAPGVADVIREVYSAFGVETETKLDLPAAHGFPTNSYGAPCGTSSSLTHGIINCNYSAAFHALNHLYGGHLVEPIGQVPLLGQFLTFDQSEFNGGASMDTEGYLYVPSGCVDKNRSCRFHLAIHGCQQGRGTIGDIYARHTGYLEAAELNNIIILFPQARANLIIGNPSGCFDWWGYGNGDYLNKHGRQMSAIHRMLVRVRG